MGQVYFVSGTGTGVGKTVTVGMMAKFLLERGWKTATVKLVQTGCENFSEDLEMHRRFMGVETLPEDRSGLTAPQIFRFPASPHLAAALEGRSVDPDRIARCVEKVASAYRITLAEGAGGLAVPLTADLLTVDFAAAQRWPVILVTDGRLGGLNHALLSLEALKSRRMSLAGVVYSHCPGANEQIDADSPEIIRLYLKKYGFHCPLVKLGAVDCARPDSAICPDFSPIFPEVSK